MSLKRLNNSSLPDLFTHELFEAVNSRSVHTIYTVLRKNPNVNARQESNGYTVLHVAALNGDVAAVMLLQSRNADVNARDNSGQTPLHKACLCGHLQIVTFLLKAGANTDIMDHSNRTAEEVAFQQNHLVIFRLLVGVKGGSDKRASLLSSVSETSAKAVRKEEEKRTQKQKKLEQKEKELLAKDDEIREQLENLFNLKEQLETIPETQRSKKDIQSLTQVTKNLKKLEVKGTQTTDKLRSIRADSFAFQGTDKGQHWIDLVQSS